MIRQLMIVLGVIALGIGYQGVALALDCPKQPQQISKDFEGAVNVEVAKIGPVSGGGLGACPSNPQFWTGHPAGTVVSRRYG